ncbi:MAG: SlyX family protein [Planctomycetales bacterium]
MITSWYQKSKEFKSPLHVVAAFLLRSRETQAAANRRLREKIEACNGPLDWETRQRRQQQKIDALQRQVVELRQQLQEAKQSVNLPEDPPLATHGYGPRMISLAVNTARSVGLRGAERVLRLVFDWLGVRRKTPSRTSIRNWLQRLGIAELQQPPAPNQDLVIMVDHSNQIGTEKVMVALGVNASELPESGTALTHEHVRVLEVKPGGPWKTEDMRREYEALADHHGTPRAVLVDGAPELRDGAQCLKERRRDMIVLRDFKHYAANVMKSLLGADERFQEVGGKIGGARSAIQQTELAHLTPPSPKQKSRFMNLASRIRWMTMIAWLLKTPDASARVGISEERMQEKLGWVAHYRDDIRVWRECQDVVSASLTFINEQALFQGAAEGLRSAIGDSLEHDKSKELAQRLIAFVKDAEQHLRVGERLPMSTEILESVFGLYKQLERQQCKSGFTSLLACLPALLKPTTPEGVSESFARVSAKDVNAWVKKHFDSTVTSRRNRAYAEHKAGLESATTQSTTT